MTLRALRVPSLEGASQGPSASSLAQHQRLEAERHALSQQRQNLLILEQRLAGITNEPRWSVNVPLGPLAWMPGQLIHTNTVKVRLSEDYVVEYSAKQATEVAKRRRQALDDRITAIEQSLKQVDTGMRKELDLPDGWSVNGNNEVVNESGLPCYEIREELSDAGEDEDWEAKRKYTAEAERQLEREEALSRASKPKLDLEAMFAEAEADEAREMQEAAQRDESDTEDQTALPQAEPAHIMELDEEPIRARETAEDQPPASPSTPPPSSPKPPLKSILSSPRLDIVATETTSSTPSTALSSPKTGPKKSVKWDVQGPQPEAKPSSRRKAAIPLPPPESSTSSNNKISTPSSSAPMKSSVVERPFNQSVKSSVVERPTANTTTAPTTPIGPKVHHFDEIGSDSDEDGDEELDGDYDEWNSEDEAADDFDALMLQRELAMQYHAKRYELGAGSGSGALGGTANPDAWALEHQVMVPGDASLATGQHTATQASRFAGGRMQNARLMVPTLLQQANLQPGDVLDNAPWSSLHGRTYTPEEEAKIQERIEQLGMSEEEQRQHQERLLQENQEQKRSDEAQPEPEIVSLEDALAEATQPQQQRRPLSQDVVDKPNVSNNGPSAHPQSTAGGSKPKRISRFKAARQEQELS